MTDDARGATAKPLLRFGLLFPLLAGGLLAAATYVAPVVNLRDRAADGIAATAATLLPLVGYSVHRDPVDPQILRAADGHGVRIGRECDALTPMLLFLAAVAVSPVPWRRRALFGLAGVAGIFLLNQARIGHLLWISQANPDAFRAAHETWWPAGLVLVAGMAFLLWARREARPR